MNQEKHFEAPIYGKKMQFQAKINENEQTKKNKLCFEQENQVNFIDGQLQKNE